MSISTNLAVATTCNLQTISFRSCILREVYLRASSLVLTSTSLKPVLSA